MADYGLKVSKPGYDIKTAGIVNQTFNSEKNCMKLDSNNNSGTVTSTGLASGGGSETYLIAHGFGFIPGYLVWFEVDNSGEWYFMCSLEPHSVKCVPHTDSTNLEIVLTNNDDLNHDVVAYYVVIADTAG